MNLKDALFFCNNIKSYILLSEVKLTNSQFKKYFDIKSEIYDYDIVSRLAKNPYLPIHIMQDIIGFHGHGLCAHLAHNIKLPQNIFDSLFNLSNPAIHMSLAINRNISKENIIKLENTNDSNVIRLLLINHSIPLKIRNKILKRYIKREMFK